MPQEADMIIAVTRNDEINMVNMPNCFFDI